MNQERRFGTGKSILYGIIIVTAILLIAEFSIRTWAYFFRGEYERYDVASGTFTLIPGNHRQGGAVITINRDGLVGPELQADGPDLFRILALGDSCTFGDGEMDSTYPVILQKQLQDAYRGQPRYEVVNGGVEGLNSQMALHRLQTKGPPLHPKVVTIYIGWNDLLKFDPIGQTDKGRWSSLTHALDTLWLTKAMRKLIFYYIRPNIMPPAVGPESRTGRFQEFRPLIYESNLRELVATTRALGAQPILLTLPTVMRKNMTLKDLKEAHVLFPYYSSAYGVGDLLDVIAAYNRSIKRIAREQTVPLVDLAEIFSQLSDVRLYFYDALHPTLLGRQLIASAIRETLAREGIVGGNALKPAA
jgi:lysophospholipase L1-like esterase